jgi:hypothetical protein
MVSLTQRMWEYARMDDGLTGLGTSSLAAVKGTLRERRTNNIRHEDSNTLLVTVP